MVSQAMAITVAVAAVGSALIAGVFFAFSTFVMTALFRLPADQGVAAMQSINKVILGSLFMPVFFGTAACCVVLVLAWFFHGGGVNEIAIPIGSALYLIGTILVTMVFNVPLNNELASIGSTGAAAAETWTRYVRGWTLWNHVRTGAALAAAIALGLAAA
jgi:uncharacterized membrane protein